MVIEQIPKKQPKNYKRTILTSIGLNPKVEVSEESSNRDFNNHEKIELFINHLKDNDLLEYKRPVDILDVYVNSKKRYVIETMVATKIIFPSESLTQLRGTQEFVLWISNPDSTAITASNFINNVTFLYIPEIWFDDERYTSVHSGCSALQAVVNYLENKYITSQEFHGDEQLGRNSNQHPIEKIVKIGAVKLSTKKITCLYKKRYITDEQCYLFNGKDARVHDLLGYPIFISED